MELFKLLNIIKQKEKIVVVYNNKLLSYNHEDVPLYHNVDNVEIFNNEYFFIFPSIDYGKCEDENNPLLSDILHTFNNNLNIVLSEYPIITNTSDYRISEIYIGNFEEIRLTIEDDKTK